jgi:hypothetical protein
MRNIPLFVLCLTLVSALSCASTDSAAGPDALSPDEAIERSAAEIAEELPGGTLRPCYTWAGAVIWPGRPLIPGRVTVRSGPESPPAGHTEPLGGQHIRGIGGMIICRGMEPGLLIRMPKHMGGLGRRVSLRGWKRGRAGRLPYITK